MPVTELRGGVDYPLLPLKNVVVFPRTALTLTFSRQKSVAALDAALLTDRRLVVVAQRNPDSADPGPGELYEVGTLVEVGKTTREPGQPVQIAVEGLRRVLIQRIVADPEYLRARVGEFPDEPDTANRALARQVIDQFERYAKFNRNVSQEAVETLSQAEGLGRLADLVAAHVPLTLAIKQGVLSTAKPVRRLQQLVDALVNENEVQELDHEIRERVRKQMDKNQREYYLREQLKAIHEELGQDLQTEIQELTTRIEGKGMPPAVAAKALREVLRLERMSSTSPETNIIRTYLETLLGLPWGEASTDEIDLTKARQILDDDHYGLEKIKDRIVEFLAVRHLLALGGTESSHGPILCFVGPPGVGKTSLGRSIARALGRKFVRISLGGVRDEAEIRGHRRTYVGALPGRIIQSMHTAGTVNPLILLDEVDKLASDYRGDPSAALLEVLDPEQNSAFSDHYLDVPYDLSRVVFITTANVIQDISRPLRDRMEVLEVSGYTEDEKLEIAKRHLLPKQRERHGLTKDSFVVTDQSILTVIRRYTREAGVRELERNLSAIARKAATKIVDDPTARLRCTPGQVADFLGPPRYQQRASSLEDIVGVATGLAWTEAGGDILPIEVATMPGKGAVTITGRLGDVMQESARAAMSYARSKAHLLGIPADFQEKLDIHIHVPEGAVPKDGPSAGITMAVALISALTGKPIRHDLAMTGEITLRGRVLAIGGLKEKVLAAHRAGIRAIVAPAENRHDWAEIPKNVRNDLAVTWVDTMDQVLQETFLPALRVAITAPDDKPIDTNGGEGIISGGIVGDTGAPAIATHQR